MTTVELSGQINEAGDLEIGQPHGLRVGAKVRVVITELDDEQLAWEERPWTEQELEELLKPGEPKTGAEIAAWLRANPDTGGWAALDIPDAAEWVRELRRKSSVGHTQS
jgi:hypothetical protein